MDLFFMLSVENAIGWVCVCVWFAALSPSIDFGSAENCNVARETAMVVDIENASRISEKWIRKSCISKESFDKTDPKE